MFIAADSLDDLLRLSLTKVMKKGHEVGATRGKSLELFGVLLQLNKPRARLSRTEKRRFLFSCLGELLWYLSKKNELSFIVYYADNYAKESEDGETVRSGYGPRLFANRGHDQIANVIETLRKKRSSRRAVVQIFEAEDGTSKKETPCTCTLQFVIRDDKLHMMTFMRSNDIYVGLPHDVFAFTMLQEIIATTLGVGLGKYRHSVGSLHLYDRDRANARKLLKEGWQEQILMPPMPKGDPWPAIGALLNAEAQLRDKQDVNVEQLPVDEYWKDLARLLQVYRFFLEEKPDEIKAVKKRMSVDVFDPFIEKKRNSSPKPRTVPTPRQLNLLTRITKQ